jgi:hypothetical protein
VVLVQTPVQVLGDTLKFPVIVQALPVFDTSPPPAAVYWLARPLEP